MAASSIMLVMTRTSHLTNGVCDQKFLPLKNKTSACKRFLSQAQQLQSFNGVRAMNTAEAQSSSRDTYDNMANMSFHQDTGRPSTGMMCKSGMLIIFISAEVAPWSKTGGLGDVLGGLPSALAANGHRVMTISPRYDQYNDAWDTSVVVELQGNGRRETVRFFHTYKRGVDRVFVDHPIYLEKVWGKTGGKLYGPKAGIDYEDNQLRFSLLCQAALEAPRVLHLNNSPFYSGPYGENVIFIANDWHTALVPCYLKSMYQSRGIYRNAKVVFCIHNIVYQGRFAESDFSRLNLPDRFRSSFDFMDGYKKPVLGRKINWMKAGILESDAVATVSPYYAEEVVSNAAKGVELDAYIRQTNIKGILNGMDVIEWSPEMDKYVSLKYDATTVFSAKPVLKEELQAEVGLPVDRNIPVIIFIGRLEEQKGSDILVQAVPELIGENVQLIILGTGKEKFEKEIEELEEKFPNKVRGTAKFNVPLAHKMLAGGDLVLIPSRFEPCGLIQFQAMLKGTVPIAPKTGGLADTVFEGVTGFQMEPFNVDCDEVDPTDVANVVSTVKRAISAYGTPSFNQMIRNCMARDLSWKGPAKKWEEFLLSLGAVGSCAGIDGVELNPTAEENVPAP